MTELPGDRAVRDLIDRCRQADEDALVALMDLTYPYVSRVVQCVSGRGDDRDHTVEDVLHEVYVEVWRRSLAGDDLGPHPAAALLELAYRNALALAA